MENGGRHGEAGEMLNCTMFSQAFHDLFRTRFSFDSMESILEVFEQWLDAPFHEPCPTLRGFTVLSTTTGELGHGLLRNCHCQAHENLGVFQSSGSILANIGWWPILLTQQTGLYWYCWLSSWYLGIDWLVVYNYQQISSVSMGPRTAIPVDLWLLRPLWEALSQLCWVK